MFSFEMEKPKWMESHGQHLETVIEYIPASTFLVLKAKFRTKIRPNSLNSSYSPVNADIWLGAT